MAPIATRDLVSPEPTEFPEGQPQKLAALKVNDNEWQKPSQTRLPKAPCRVYDFIRYQVATQPAAPAVQFSTSEFVTYLELSELATKIALAISIQPRTIVPLCMDPSVSFIATILAILNAGAAYVVLDPHGSVERNNGIVNDCNANIVVVDKVYAPIFENSIVLASAIEKISPNGFVSLGPCRPFHDSEVRAEDPAYLVYTSG